MSVESCPLADSTNGYEGLGRQAFRFRYGKPDFGEDQSTEEPANIPPGEPLIINPLRHSALNPNED